MHFINFLNFFVNISTQRLRIYRWYMYLNKSYYLNDKCHIYLQVFNETHIDRVKQDDLYNNVQAKIVYFFTIIGIISIWYIDIIDKWIYSILKKIYMYHTKSQKITLIRSRKTYKHRSNMVPPKRNSTAEDKIGWNLIINLLLGTVFWKMVSSNQGDFKKLNPIK